jgi:hypothetical protein
MEMLKFGLKVLAVIAAVRLIEKTVVPANSSIREYLP